MPPSFSSRVLPWALLTLALTLAGCHRSDPSKPDHPRITAGAAMQEVHFYSPALAREVPYRVFLPEKIDAGQKLQVVYLLHGGGGSYRDWSNDSDVAAYAARGLILVMPEGNSSYYVNAVGRPRDKYEDYLTHDLIVDVEGRFPARTGRQNRAVVGVSMGGFGAVKLALSHPELFFFAGAISPAIDVPERRFTWRRAGQWLGFREIFGPWGSKDRDARDPFVLVQSAEPKATPYLYLTAAEQEALLEPNRRFAARLKHQGIAFEFHTLPGGHDWGEWNAQIPDCFKSLFERIGSFSVDSH